MSNILSVFESSITEEKLQYIEKVSKEYAGIEGDMDNNDLRKFIKAKSSEVTDIRKRLEAARISINKANALEVNNEAGRIDDRLALANKPFSQLMDDHKIKRDKILADKKARQDAIDLAFEIERDHDYALLMDAQVMRDKADAIQAQMDRDAIIATQAAGLARQEMQRQQEAKERAEAAAVAARLADKESVGKILRAAKEDLMLIQGVDEALAKSIVLSIRNNTIRNTYIKY
jgi:hypothetical protein